MVSREKGVTAADKCQHVFVDTDHSINTAIRKLRQLLRDDSETPKYIETVTGMGYRFVASVSLVAPVSPVAPVSAVAPALAPEDTPEPSPAAASPPRRKALVWYMGVGACMVIALGSVALYQWPHRRLEVRYTQLTDFTDSAVAPTLSPDVSPKGVRSAALTRIVSLLGPAVACEVLSRIKILSLKDPSKDLRFNRLRENASQAARI